MLLFEHQLGNSSGNFAYNAYIYHGVYWYPHFHRNFELVYIKHGRLDIRIDSLRLTLSEHDFCLVLQNQIHEIIPQKDCIFWVAVFSSDYVPSFIQSVHYKTCAYPVFRCDAHTESFLLEMLIDRQGQSILRLQALLLLSCDVFLSSVTLTEDKGNRDAAFKTLDIIYDRYKEDISLENIARELGYEYHYLSRCIGKTLQMNFRQILNYCRCDYAVQLLKNTDNSVLDIALACGYNNVRTFNDSFKKLSGLPPSQYRKK